MKTTEIVAEPGFEPKMYEWLDDRVPGGDAFLYAIKCLDPFGLVDGISMNTHCLGPVLLRDISGMLGPQISPEVVADCLDVEANLDAAFCEP